MVLHEQQREHAVDERHRGIVAFPGCRGQSGAPYRRCQVSPDARAEFLAEHSS
jgi:hypothetical protein